MYDEMKQAQEYFGFDLGDGESAVAWAKRGSRNEPQLIEIAGRKNVLTAIGQHAEMGTLIGEQAFLADAERLHLRFKSDFLHDPGASEPLIRAFARAVLSELMKPGKLTDISRSAFFVGCPSGWSDSERERYRALFVQAGFLNVTIVSESRAAFMFVRESGELSLGDEALARPALIIDAGSSTTDFTFINQLQTVRAFDFGETHLGGGLIDQMLLRLNVARCPGRDGIEAAFARFPQYRARAELEARKVKEMWFTRQAQSQGARFEVPCESSVKIYSQRPPLTLDIACGDEDMRRVLSMPVSQLLGKSYLEAYRDCLTLARDQLLSCPPELILLTGGASRMAFIAGIAREVFPHASIQRGAEPEFSIARGLCYALRVDVKAGEFEREVKQLIDADQIEEIILGALPPLFHQLSQLIADELIEVSAVDAFKRWKSGELNTLFDMGEVIRRELADSIREGAVRERLGPLMRGWIERIRPQIETLTDPITAKYELPMTSLRLPSALEVEAMRLDLPANNLMSFTLLQTIVDVTVASIVAAILGGGGVALLMAGPVGFVISFAIGFVASRLGTGYAKKHLDKLELPQFLRLLFTASSFERQLQSKREQMERQFADQLIGLIDPPSAQVQDLIGSVSGAIEGQLGQLAEQARLLIH